MKQALLRWILSALAVWVVSQIVPGFIVQSAVAALLAAVVIGFVNGTVGLVLKIVTLPLSIMTLGLFWLVINAVMIQLASLFVPGFQIENFLAAFLGGIVLGITNMFLRPLAD